MSFSLYIYLYISEHNQNAQNDGNRAQPLAFRNSVPRHKDVHWLHHRSYMYIYIVYLLYIYICICIFIFNFNGDTGRSLLSVYLLMFLQDHLLFSIFRGNTNYVFWNWGCCDLQLLFILQDIRGSSFLFASFQYSLDNLVSFLFFSALKYFL